MEFQNDFMKILTGLVPMVKIPVQGSENHEISHKYIEAPGKIIEYIMSEKQLRPYIYVDIQCLSENGEVIYSYYSRTTGADMLWDIKYYDQGKYQWFRVPHYVYLTKKLINLEEGPQKLETNHLEYCDFHGFGKPAQILDDVVIGTEIPSLYISYYLDDDIDDYLYV